MPEQVTIAVRPLVEYVFRGGSLDSGFQTLSTLTEGTKAHQAIQSKYGVGDRREVYVRGEIACGDLLFVLDGRCDGVLTAEDGSVTIEEIKSTSGDVRSIQESSYPVHWAQARCYAYLYACEHGLDFLKIQLTYVSIGSADEPVRFVQEASKIELERFIADLLNRYAPYARLQRDHARRRDESIRELAFPFPAYRQGQRKLAGAVYKSIEAGSGLFARAPTGIGKTISTLFPAVKAIGQDRLQQLFYLTAKTTTRRTAEEAFARMRDKGLLLHSVTITAKEKICFQEQVDCRAEACEYADGYYDRINEAIADALVLSGEAALDQTAIESYARKHRVCPFEFSLEAAYVADAVICDYNYIFDPRASLKRLFAERKAQTALLVDEAHNLADRARDMYSAELNKRDFLLLEREFKGIHAELHESARTINRLFLALKKQEGGRTYTVKQQPEQVGEAIEQFAAVAEKVLAARNGPGADGSLLLETYFAALAFARIAKLYDERYVTFVECSGNEVRLKLLCLDPSHLLRQYGKSFRSRIFFSATLSPLGFYMDVLGAGEEDCSVSVASPFSPEQWEVSVLPVSTRYADRDRSIAPITRCLSELMASRSRGNYLFFFPSYAYMNEVYEAFAAAYPDRRTLLQQSGMSDDERDRFLSAFDADNEEPLAAFAVLGGAFSEGIDLVGDRLTGVVVVGVGLPQLGPERDLIRSYFDSAIGRGFDYAYVFPGMNKVLQAGGRLIRSESDRGVLVLADDRYLQPQYRRLLPEEWREFHVLPLS